MNTLNVTFNTGLSFLNSNSEIRELTFDEIDFVSGGDHVTWTYNGFSAVNWAGVGAGAVAGAWAGGWVGAGFGGGAVLAGQLFTVTIN